jgi:protein SCO1/2
LLLSLVCGLALCGAAPKSAKVLEATSLQDAAGKPVKLPDGRIWVLTFFYGSCTQVCPALLGMLGDIRSRFKPAERGRLAFGAVTFDPAHDSPEHLGHLAREFHLDQPGSAVLTGDRASVTKVLETFDFSFMPDGEGGYDHSNLVAVMDGAGKVVAHLYGLTSQDRAEKAVRALLGS